MSLPARFDREHQGKGIPQIQPRVKKLNTQVYSVVLFL